MNPQKKQPGSGTPARPSWHDEGLDFEPTDFGEARRVLDNESISQFDVATVVSPGHWKGSFCFRCNK